MIPDTWQAREPGARFAVFRIALGAVLLADVVHLFAHRALFAREWPGLVPLGPVLLLWMAVLCAFVAGAWTRYAATANYLLAVALLGERSAISQVAGDSIALSLSLLAVFLPCGAALSIDRWSRKDWDPSPAFACERWALAGLLSLVYADSALRKLCSPMWRDGLGFVAPATLPSTAWIDTGWLEAIPTPLLRAAGLGVVAFELLFPALYAFRPTLTPAVLVGIAMHLGIAVLYPIPVFSGLMLAIYITLLPSCWYAPLERLDRTPERPSPTSPRLPFYLPAKVTGSAAAAWLALTVVLFAADFIPSPGFWRVWGPVRGGIFRATGILDHGVFDDGMLHPYRYQVRLVPVRDGVEGNAMPYAREGLFAWSVRDRVWEHWWKRTQAPWVSVADVERRLGDWAAFYWPAVGGPAEVRIEARPQTVVLDDVAPHLFRENRCAAWREVGRVRLTPDGAPRVRWSGPASPRESPFGESLLRLLGQEPQAAACR